MIRAPYLEWLDATLPDRYASDLFHVGRINGLLEALANLNNRVNHVPSFGFVEIELQERAPFDAVAERYAHLGRLELVALAEWLAPTRQALREITVDDCEEIHTLREELYRAVDGIVHALQELFREQRIEAYSPRLQGAAANGMYGYIRDDTLIYVVHGSAATRAYVLGLGWSD
jgi:hypothetical protein